MSKSFFESEEHSDFYARCRPTYPVDVMKKILVYLSSKYTITDDDLAIDVGCGTGQSTVLLAPFFRKVIGYDISESQIQKANETNSFPNVQYQTMKNNVLPHPDSSVALIISAHAAHWFDLPRFYDEAKRTLKPNGVLAVFGYAFVRVHGPQAEKFNELLHHFYHQTLDGYVQNESKDVYFGRYRDERFRIPFSSNDFLRDETLAIRCRWPIKRLLGYILSWSGSQQYLKNHPDTTIFDDLQKAMFECLQIDADPNHELDLSFDIFILMNRKYD